MKITRNDLKGRKPFKMRVIVTDYTPKEDKHGWRKVVMAKCHKLAKMWFSNDVKYKIILMGSTQYGEYDMEIKTLNGEL